MQKSGEFSPLFVWLLDKGKIKLTNFDENA